MALLFLLLASGPTLPLAWAFWIAMFVALVWGFWWPQGQPYYRRYLGYHLLGWICIFLLGWQAFGLPGIGR